MSNDLNVATPFSAERTRSIDSAARSARSHIVIPARLASSRLPRKLLLRDSGQSVLEHTYRSACRASRPGGISIAVDCDELRQEVESFGGHAIVTDPALPSGTDRVRAAARELPDVDIFVNVQGDEPEISGDAIDQVVQLLEDNPEAAVSTLSTPIREQERLDDPSCVKVVRDTHGNALYFSRSPIPFVRDATPGLLDSEPSLFWQHIGIYAYRREFLMDLANLPVSDLEQLEKLEQLRFLQAGAKIQVGTTDHSVKGIDTADDYREFLARQAA